MSEHVTGLATGSAFVPSTPGLPAVAEFSGRLSDLAREYVEAVRVEAERATWAGEHGMPTAVRFAHAIDRLVAFVVDVTTDRFAQRYARGQHQRCALIAQGGYGRYEMSPWSDVDLLIVYPGRISPYVETITERVIQTLFDAQLQVGWAVRTFKDCIEQADRDLTIKTTMLDGRFIAGSRELGAQFTETVQDVLAARDVEHFLTAKRAESQERRARFGDSVFLLEPNVKEGQGGLRDLHTLLWIGRLVRGIVHLEEVAERGIASDSELSELLAARDFLLRVRHALHVLARFKQDKLAFDSQEKIAQRFGYHDDERNSAVELFMRDYYTNAAIVARTTADLIDRLTARPEPKGLISRLGSRSLRDGVSIASGQLVVEERVFERDPVEMIRVFADAQRNDVTLSARTREVVRRNTEKLSPEVAQSRVAIDTFMGILKATDGVYRTLGEMNRLGVLGRLIPEFGRLFCMVQHDFYHIYTVDEHSLIGIRELERLREGAFAEENPLLTQVMRECDRPELLFLAMMFHDLGKGYGGDHDERGARMVVEIARRLRLNLDERKSLEFLVRHHLLMSMLAQNRDIEDPHLVAEFVSTVGSQDNLRYLYLLTFADMKAVGPQIWNGWKDHLLGDLYQRAVEAIETGVVTERNLASRVRRAKKRVVDQVSGEDEQRRLEEFVSAMPDSYMLSTTIDRVIDHWRLCESLGGGLFRAGVSHFKERGFSELTVCTNDRPGLFARLSGVLSAHALNILSAKIVTSTNGLAIDTFRIDHGEEPAETMGAEVWTAVRADIERALDGSLDVASMVAEQRRKRPAPTSVRKARRRATTHVSVDNEVSRDHTVIDVYAADRPGLLFTVADCINRLGLTIHLAKITTRVHQVLDVFYVTDEAGNKVDDPAAHERIGRIILERIRESDEQEGPPIGRVTGAA